MNRFQVISCNKFQKTAFYRLVYLHEILSIFIKSPDFNEIKEITDFKQFYFNKDLPNEQISVDIQKRAFYRLLYLSEILPKSPK